MGKITKKTYEKYLIDSDSELVTRVLRLSPAFWERLEALRELSGATTTTAIIRAVLKKACDEAGV